MPPSFLPRLIHYDPFADPGLFVSFSFTRQALLFDAGDLSPLSPRDLLKISHVFLSHAHMDHFMGFDRLLRVLIGRERTLTVVGPLGITDRVEAKLASYTWNLVDNFENNLSIVVVEKRKDCHEVTQFDLNRGFARTRISSLPPSPLVAALPGFTVEAAILDHKIDCLGFALWEPYRINILKVALAEKGLEAGPWLAGFKKALHEKAPPDSPVIARTVGKKEKTFTLGQLQKDLVKISLGQKIAYITDAAPTKANGQLITDLCRNADTVFIEAAFLEEDAALAEKRGHLTAAHAGRLAALANAKNLVVFHFSPRYSQRGQELANEAMRTFGGNRTRT
ncbi:MAG: MBL fold metallo-hydrolase [Desulfatibacillaceae bacterium]|nr:MBL fold metallo-hydrolase [Desulfatibacillaceae bacterium]